MKRLTPKFQPEIDAEKKLSRFVTDIKARRYDKNVLRDKVVNQGIKVRRIKPEEPDSARILCCDSSIVSKSLRFLNIWGIHTVTLCAKFDSGQHDDPLIGQGKIRYQNMMYDSDIFVKDSASSEELEKSINSFRIFKEYDNLLKGYETLGKEVDFLIVDGSIYTNSRNLDDNLDVQKKLLKRCVSMVEDSHSVDLTKGLELKMSNLNLFDLILEPLEYIVDEKEDVNVCYIKLPPKDLDFLPSRVSEPITVRWEFSYAGFEKDLDNLVGIWMCDKDALHSQIYPVRIADYLTRRIKVSGLLDEVIREGNLSPQFRDMRVV